MIFRRFYTSFLILGFAAEVWSHVEIEAEDYFFPLEPVINFCKMAEQCQHDFVPICGQDSLGITRMFNDNCDLYEYNCDDKKPRLMESYEWSMMEHDINKSLFTLKDLKIIGKEEYRHVKMEVCKYEAAAAERL